MVCDGAAGFTSEPDNTDLPDNSNPCTDGTCDNGQPSHAALPSGCACPGGVCDDQGACVPCNSGQSCSTGLPGVCEAGTTDCTSGAPNCVPIIQPGSQPELCNGLDDDCDGDIDNGFDVGQPCGDGGVLVCSQDGQGVGCDES